MLAHQMEVRRCCGSFRRAICCVSTVVFLGAAVSRQSTYAAEDKAHTTWSAYEGSVDSDQYSALKQINKSNVNQLQQAWFYSAAGAHRFECSPIIVDGVMYVIGKNDNVVALDAATGREIWVHDNGNPHMISERGFTYWESKDRSDRRLFFATNNILHAVDARTGKTIESFGNQGDVDLREGLGRDIKSIREIESGTPGRIFENLLILGSTPGEEYGSPPGDLRALDVLTGKLVWTFHTVPHPGDMGYETWPKNAWKYVGGTNTWGGITIDEKRGIAYFPIGSPTYDFYGADREGADLYSDCLLALDARTGKYLWHFQIIHHDLWDYDLATAPKLVTVKQKGRVVDAVAAAGKTGFLYVFDRVTGKPVWPIEERPVPQFDHARRTCVANAAVPDGSAAFRRAELHGGRCEPLYSGSGGTSEVARSFVACTERRFIYAARIGERTEPVGNNGGANWGNAAVDPATNVLYVQAKNVPTMLKLEAKPPRIEIKGSPETQGQLLYIQNCQTCHTSQLTGQPPAVPSLVDIVSRVGAERIRSVVTNGASPMPAFPDLSGEDIDSLIAYLSAPGAARVPPDIVAFFRPRQLRRAGCGGRLGCNQVLEWLWVHDLQRWTLRSQATVVDVDRVRHEPRDDQMANSAGRSQRIGSARY